MLTQVQPQMSLGGPVFSAYQSSAQTLSSVTYTLLSFQTKNFDTGGCFNNTNSSTTLNGLTAPAYSFTPNVAGYYQVSGGLSLGTTATGTVTTIYKNGSVVNFTSYSNPSTVSGGYGSALVYLNGTGDYIQLYGYITLGQVLASGSGITYFQSAFIRSA